MAINVLDTIQNPLIVLRAEANEEASPINLVSEGDFAQKPSDAFEIRTDGSGLNSLANDAFIMFSGGDAALKTFTWRLFSWLAINGPAQLVAFGTGTLGSQAVIIYPNGSAATNKFWAHTLVVTAFSWPKEVRATPNGGNNSVAMLSLDLMGRKHWKMQIEDADGLTGNEAGDISAYWSRK